MATVPGRPTDDTGGIPKSLQPTQADMLIAASLVHERQVASIGDPKAKIPDEDPESVSYSGFEDAMRKLKHDRLQPPVNQAPAGPANIPKPKKGKK